ncbi:hypothetical protein M1O20_04340 [Dehalococcoidia bacterium]|nr:hypothetical protein [Dehalococcoidia bacterium]MCL0079608.1 hypothetical protein [Dehalococcoidia bacterium]MCL0089590.1 hypothetical protein [Dehalococcoidia bacterium]
MRKDEIARNNVGLVFDFLRFLIDHPELVEKIPDGAELRFLDKDALLKEPDVSRETEAKRVFLQVEHVFSVSGQLLGLPPSTPKKAPGTCGKGHH